MSLLSGSLFKCRLPVSWVNRSFTTGESLFAKTILGSLIGKGKIAATGMPKKLLPVETNPKKLVEYCCGSNIFKEGEDAKLKDDAEYPDWLWNLRLGPPPPLDEMDPNTKEYWEQLFFLHRNRQLRLSKIKQKKKLFVNEQDKIYKLKQIRFRALAHKYDPGYDEPQKFDKSGWKII